MKQPVVKVLRRTKTGAAPGWPGATSENTGGYRWYSTRGEQRPALLEPGCGAGRLQEDFHHGLLAQPVAVEHDLGPAGEVDPVVAPFDPLCSPG